METLAHSISAATSRTVARSVVRRMAWPASVISLALWFTSPGGGPPTACGQKYCNWRSAAEWKVRACTPGAPSARSRWRISLAARAVNVRARVFCGV